MIARWRGKARAWTEAHPAAVVGIAGLVGLAFFVGLAVWRRSWVLGVLFVPLAGFVYVGTWLDVRARVYEQTPEGQAMMAALTERAKAIAAREGWFETRAPEETGKAPDGGRAYRAVLRRELRVSEGRAGRLMERMLGIGAEASGRAR